MTTLHPRAVVGSMLTVAATAVLAMGCGASSEVEPRCTIEADGRHRARLAREINGSKVWRTYFKHIGDGQPIVAFVLDWEHSRFRSSGGDYDPGKVAVAFEARHIASGRTLYERQEEVDLKSFMVGAFDRNATRDEIQEIAFKATEDSIYPFLAVWVDLAGIRAMGNEGSSGDVFEDFLVGLTEDKWSNLDIRARAEEALKEIRGG